MFKLCFTALILMCVSLSMSAQKVGLVLSGGGSKGLAHIGVIRALEEKGVPIDCIGGTSMGAIVGSLYAMGYTCDEMEAIIESDEFSYWMAGELKEEDRFYFKEEEPGPDLINVGLNIKDTVAQPFFPLSLIPSQLMDFAFMKIFSRPSAAAGYNFDSLFVPFLCIAADISNSKELVFRSGDLAQAVRASMTVPLYFRPIVVDSAILYDGGIYNNFPVDRVKESFNPDIIIGSKAAEGNRPPDEYDVLKQIENLVMNPSDYYISPGEGVLLDMKFDRPALLDFDQLDYFVDVGYRTAMGKMDSIQLLVQRKAPPAAVLNEKREAFINSWPEFRFDSLSLHGLNEKQEEYVRSSFHLGDSALDLVSAEKEYLKLANDKSLTYLYPRAKYEEEDTTYTFDLRVIPEAPFEARFGLFIATTGQAQTYLGLSYREIQEVSMHLKGSLQFGRLYDGVNMGFRFDYPSRIPVFFQGNFSYNGFNYNSSSSQFFFEDLEPPFIQENEFNFRFDVGLPVAGNRVFKGGLGAGTNKEVYYTERDFTSNDTSEISQVNLLSIYAAFEKNSLNNKQFATSGSHSKLNVRAGYGREDFIPGSTSELVLNEQSSYYWVSGRYHRSGYVQMKNKWSLGYLLEAQALIKPLQSTYYSSLIEAPVFRPNLVAKAQFMEAYRAHFYLAAGIMPVYSISKNIHAKLEAYGYFPFQEILKDEFGRAYFGNYFEKMYSIFNVSINALTVAGPVGLHVAHLSALERPWVIQLSFGYLLFNKKSNED